MKSLIFLCVCLIATVAAQGGDVVVENVVLAIHGGIGLDKAEMTPEIDKAVRAGLTEALKAGSARLLQPNATALDAVETAIRIMEDNPLFNAGKGAVFTNDGRNELDSSIMDGQTLKAGSVAGVTTIKNPISAARAVMDKSKHVMLISKGAETFAAEQKLEIVDPKYFWTEDRWKQLQKYLEEEKKRSQIGPLDDNEVAMLLASQLYEQGKLSLGQAAELVGLTKRTFAELLGRYKVSIFNYPASDLFRDVKNA